MGGSSFPDLDQGMRSHQGRVGLRRAPPPEPSQDALPEERRARDGPLPEPPVCVNDDSRARAGKRRRAGLHRTTERGHHVSTYRRRTGWLRSGRARPSACGDAGRPIRGPAHPRPGDPGGRVPMDALDVDRREADRYLTTLSARLTAKGLQVHYQRLEGSPTELIAEHARSQDADLIAVASHGHGGVRGTRFGRVAEVIILTAPCSLLIVRVDGAR